MFEKATILYLTLSWLSSWDGWQQVGIWCGVWQDYHKHAARPPIGFQPIKPSFFSSSTIFPFLLPTARSICLLFSSLAFNRSEMIWAQMLDKWSDYRKIEARTVYIALFPIHRIQISATYRKTLEMCLSFQNKNKNRSTRTDTEVMMEKNEKKKIKCIKKVSILLEKGNVFSHASSFWELP